MRGLFSEDGLKRVLSESKAVSLLAMLVPARRAAKINPASA
jgi:ABC-type lipoprotein release transport system permease subunit